MDDLEVRILRQDDDIVVVDKPAGCAVHKVRGDPTRPLLQRVRDLVGTHVYPVHRLDRATSGVVVFGLSSEAAAALALGFRERSTDKTYWALARGLTDAEGRIDHAVRTSRDRDAPKKDAITDYRRLWELDPWCTLLEVRPLTGRTHQIRKHFKHLRRPLLGDVRYGKGRLNAFYRETYGLERLALHAARLGFEHPRGGQVWVQSGLPEDLAQPLQKLGVPEDLLEELRCPSDPPG